MPWPFDDSDDPFKRNDIFSNFDKEFENMFKMLDGLHQDPFSRRDRNLDSDQDGRKSNVINGNPRSYFLHDPRHCNERRTKNSNQPSPKPNMLDTEVDIGDNYGALLGNENMGQRLSPPFSSNTRESVSTTWTMKNGKMCKQERREQTCGRQRRVSITSTDENGNTATNEYTEEI